ncbi:MAG: hypothetical protein JSU07_12675 [Bacteroidetes bacterium]|nr:hypothetical protein [Bacteroidota bacterium]
MGNIIFLVLVLASFYGLGKLFIKANIPQWKAYVPFYNFFTLSKLLNKPWWWCLIMAIPGVNILMYGVYGFNVARAFNKPSNNDLWFASLLPYIFFVKIAHDPTAKFVGLDKFKIEPSKIIKNWVDPIVFAVIAASIIRGYFIEAFTIPTSSLEKSLMVGDFLFVNKFAYGPKIPQTPLSFPFAHHTMPVVNTKSYLEWIKLPYFRLPGFGTVKNNDIVVFNYPDGDTVALNQQNQSYYQMVRNAYHEISQYNRSKNIKLNDAELKKQAWTQVNSGDNYFGDIVARPKDKREHYVKRCVAIAGNEFEIKNGHIYINKVEQKMPPKAQHNYFVKAKSEFIDKRYLDNLDIYYPEAFKVVNAITETKDSILGIQPIDFMDENRYYPMEDLDYKPFRNTFTKNKDTVLYLLNMTVETSEKVKADPNVYQVIVKNEAAGKYDYKIFPHKSTYAWNNDNFGPLIIPKAGLTLPIDTHNLCLYQKVMDTYDDGIHHITTEGAKVLYDGKPITSYTFKQDYYFMMGDNRHNSADSRSWGLVPFDHVVGSPFFVWLSVKYEENNPVSGASFVKGFFKNSKEGKYRWDRFFSYVDAGNLVSIKIPFIITVVGLWGYSRWSRKRKEKKQKEKK